MAQKQQALARVTIQGELHVLRGIRPPVQFRDGLWDRVMVRQWSPTQVRRWLKEQNHDTTLRQVREYILYLNEETRARVSVERKRADDLVAPALSMLEGSLRRIRTLYEDLDELDAQREKMVASWRAEMDRHGKFTPHASEATAVKQLVLARKDLLEQLRKEETFRREHLQAMGILDTAGKHLTVRKTTTTNTNVSIGVDIRVLAQGMNAVMMRFVPAEKRAEALQELRAFVESQTSRAPIHESSQRDVGRALPNHGEEPRDSGESDGLGAPTGLS